MDDACGGNRCVIKTNCGGAIPSEKKGETAPPRIVTAKLRRK